MDNEQIRAFLLNHNDRLIVLSKSSTQEYIDEVNYLLDKGYLKPNGNSYIKSAKGTDFLSEMETKSLEIRILEHLKIKNAKVNKIDIAAPFLVFEDDFSTRMAISKTLEYLQKEKFIELNGYPPTLCSTISGQLGSKYQTGIGASITKLGEKELLPLMQLTPITHSSVNHNYNFEKSQTPIVNSTIQESRLNIDNSLAKQTSINSNPNIPTKKSWVEVLYWIVGIIVGAILLYDFVIKHLQWV